VIRINNQNRSHRNMGSAGSGIITRVPKAHGVSFSKSAALDGNDFIPELSGESREAHLTFQNL
jgi:hypothetical protein